MNDSKPDPYADLPHPERDYYAFLAEGRFMIQRARKSGAYVFHPRVSEPGTGDTDLEWVAASGKGTVYSTTVIRTRDPKKDYNIALIDLAEGPRMMSRIEGIDAAAVNIGMDVVARIVPEGERHIVVFEPA